MIPPIDLVDDPNEVSRNEHAQERDAAGDGKDDRSKDDSCDHGYEGAAERNVAYDYGDAGCEGDAAAGGDRATQEAAVAVGEAGVTAAAASATVGRATALAAVAGGEDGAVG